MAVLRLARDRRVICGATGAFRGAVPVMRVDVLPLGRTLSGLSSLVFHVSLGVNVKMSL